MMQQFGGELIAFIFQKATDEGMDNNSCFPCAPVLKKSFLFRRHAVLLSVACSNSNTACLLNSTMDHTS